jgi:hypothetical protein
MDLRFLSEHLQRNHPKKSKLNSINMFRLGGISNPGSSVSLIACRGLRAAVIWCNRQQRELGHPMSGTDLERTGGLKRSEYAECSQRWSALD